MREGAGVWEIYNNHLKHLWERINEKEFRKDRSASGLLNFSARVRVVKQKMLA